MNNIFKSFLLTMTAFALALNDASANKVIASSYGYTKSDATKALQSAIKSGADSVIIDNTGSDWITDPNVFSDISNLTIIFEAGVVIKAKAAVYTSTDACLFKLNECKNIQFLGNGAVLKMNKSEYTNGEWRHSISLRGCSNILIEGLSILDSGGDGIYIGKGKTLPCEKITVRNCFISNHKRQGISIVSAQHVLIENCDIAGTKGTPPMAGIDFEPNANTELLTDCIVRNCNIHDNAGTGIAVVLHTLDASSKPIGLIIENTWVHDNTGGPQLFIMNRDKGIVAGNIDIKNCLIENSQDAGLFIMKNREEFGIQVTNCVFNNVANVSTGSKAKYTSPIMFETKVNKNPSNKAYGGANFKNCLVNYTSDKPAMHAYRFANDENLSNNNGSLTVVNPYQRPLFDNKTSVNSNIKQEFLPSLPKASVSLSAQDTIAAETGGDDASFTVTRAKAENYPLPVAYTLTGNAANRNDYEYLNGMAIIPANETSATIKLVAKKDAISEKQEKVFITLKNGPFYTSDKSKKICIIIH